MPRTAVTGYRKANLNDPYSVYFNGTSAKMTVPVVPDPTGWCFAMWIKPGDKGVATHTYMSYNTAAFTNGIFVGAGSGKSTIEVQVYNSTTIISTRTITATVGDWVHIAATYLPNGTCKIYRNGVLIGSATSTGTMSVATAQTLTFNSRSYSGSYAQSTMSNIVWQNTTTSWTDAQVLDLYQSDTVPAGVTMYLAMNEGTGTTATDTSGNGNNGTLTAPTWTTDTPTKLRTAVAVEPLPIVNAGFETAPTLTTATNVNGRYIDGTAGGSATDVGYKWKTSSCTNSEVKFDSSQKYTGNYSMKLSTLSTGAIVTVEQIYTDLSFKAKPNTSYIMTLKMKTQFNSGSSSSGAYGILSQRNSAGAITNTNYSVSVLTTTDWTQYSIRMTTYPETVYITFGVAINGSNGAGTLVMDAWFDDIEIKEVIPQRKTLDNLLSNGNFEYAPPFTAATTTVNRWIDGTSGGSSKDDSPYRWFILSSSANTFSAQFDTSVYRSGAASLKLSTTNATGISNASMGSNANRQTVERTAVPALPNTTYTITGWIKTNNAATDAAYFDIVELNNATAGQATNSTSKLSGTNDWTQLTKTFTTTSATRYLLVICRNNVAGNISDVWFDDITLTTTAPYRNRKSIDNLVTNGDFESVPAFTAATTVNGRWIDGTASGSSATEGPYKWACVTGSSLSACSWQFDSTVSHSGTTSLKIDITNATGFANISNYLASPTWENAIPCLPSTSYTLSAWVKTTTAPAGGSYIMLRTFTGAFTTISSNSSSLLTGTNDWTLLQVTFTTESTARFIAPLLRTSTGQASTTWFDDITLVKN